MTKEDGDKSRPDSQQAPLAAEVVPAAQPAPAIPARTQEASESPRQERSPVSCSASEPPAPRAATPARAARVEEDTRDKSDHDQDEDRGDEDEEEEENFKNYSDESEYEDDEEESVAPARGEGQLGHSGHSSAPPARREPEQHYEERRVRNARELMTEELSRRASYANPKLRAQLVGSILVHVKGVNQERYLFDWSTETLSVTTAPPGTPADCTITILEDNLMRIVSGDLNPQIGMLSDKITLDGRPNLAVYFFNLIAPRGASL